MVKVYLDCCCYCRPFDDLSQAQVNDEYISILRVIDLRWRGIICIVGSTALKNEIEKIGDPSRRLDVYDSFSSNINEVVTLTDGIKSHAYQIQAESNIQPYDSLHIACAEESGADFMLTTDYKLIKMASRLDLKVKVMNPKDFADQYLNGGDYSGTGTSELQ
ncbi:MAG: PIN domain-containing protein [Oscillospiraceae bacterium]|nr:PIN domain-containing protein [Oscillospiraceae bacterium]